MKRIFCNAPLSSSSLLELRDYWLSRRNGKIMPARRDIDPLDIPRLLPHVALTDVCYDPLRFRFRLIGTGIVAMAGRDATGKWLDQALYGNKLDQMLWGFRTCVEEKSPVAIREAVLFVDREWVVVEVLFLPLGEADGVVNMVLSGVKTVHDAVNKPSADSCFILNWQMASAQGTP